VAVPRYNIQTQAVYSELLERLQLAEIQELSEQEGSFVRRLVKGNPYWYLRRRIGDRINERYVGPETPQLLERIETLKAQSKDAMDAAKGRRDLIRRLRSDGYLMTDRRTGQVIEELARAGVFRLDGVLIGTHAFRCYSALLGVRLQHEFAETGDVDIAQDSSVSLGIHESTDPAIGDALAKAERFVEIPDLNPKNRETLAAGIILLQPGEEDTQAPHDSDEIYYVIRGNGYLKINKKDYPVSEGKAFFVAKNVEHFFFGNSKELVALYFFGGPDS